MQEDVLTDQLNRPLRDLRISLTDRCNFRCAYCMPKALFGANHAFMPRSQLLSFEEIERLARLFVGLGVRKLRLTGGEPLIRRDLDQLIGMLAGIDGVEDISLTTNASSAYPGESAGVESGRVEPDHRESGRDR